MLTLQDRKIEELKQSLLRYKKVQDMVMSVQGKKGETTLQSEKMKISIIKSDIKTATQHYGYSILCI